MIVRFSVSRRMAIFAILITTISALAQNPGTGIYPYSRLDSFGFDSVNPGNLNVHFVIPIVTKEGRGLPFQYSLEFDSLIWTPTVSGSSTVWTPDPSFGLHGYLLNDGYKGYLSYSSVAHKCFDDPSDPSYWEWLAVQSNYVYHDEFGVSHSFNYSYNVCTGTATGNGATADGSGLIFDGSNVRSRSGLKLSLPTYLNGAVSTLNSSITDSNGNQITNNSTGTFTDTMGKTPLSITGSGTPSSPRVFTFSTTTGTSHVTIAYVTKTVKTAFSCSGITEYGPTSVNLPATITLPDNSTYVINYESTPGVSGDVTGRIASIQLPTGGTISYTYEGANDGTSCLNGSTLGLSRSTSVSTDGTTSYSRTNISSAKSHTEITGAHGDQTEIDYAYSAGIPYETTRAVYSGTHTGTLLAKTDTCYNTVVPPNCTAQSVTMPFTQISVYRTIGSSENGSDTLFNGYGLPTDIKEYDYAAGARGALLRETKYTYAVLGSYLTDKVSWVQVYDGGGHEYAATNYVYDGTTPTATSGLPQHVSVSGPRGNLTSEFDFSSASAYIATQFTTDDAGQVRTVWGTNPESITFGYDTTDTLLTSISPLPLNGVPLNAYPTYDPNTGLIISSKDANSQTTSYHFDAMLRPSEVDAADSGKVTTSYTPTQISTHAYQNASTYMDTEQLLDSLGRPTRAAVGNGQGANPWYQTDVCINQTTLTTFTSYPYAGSGFGSSPVCSGSGGDLVTYDPLGRVLRTLHGDGSSVTYQYAGRSTKTTNENGVTRITQVDGIGRVTAVCEISSNSTMPGSSGTPVSCGMDISGTGFLTTYAYNMANLTTSIAQGVQTRSFQTDWLGRTTLVQEPETGQTTYSYSYSTPGLTVIRKRPKANQSSASVLTTTTIQYDGLGRLLSISYDDGTPTKTFAYDASAGWTDLAQTNLAGQLSMASTSNAKTVYSYDPVGRIQDLEECFPSGCGNTAYDKNLHYTYDWVGNVLTSTDGSGVKSTYAYTVANELKSLTSSLSNTTNPANIVSSVTNTPNGPSIYTLGNGLSTVNSFDSIGRFAGGWTCQGSTAHNCVGGTEFEGSLATFNGTWPTNVCEDDPVANQCWNIGYDEFGRMKSFTTSQGTPNSYTYTYDRWGNRWTQTAVNGGPSPSLSFNVATNQVQGTGYGYDAAGNMFNDSFHSYTYDAEGNITQVDSGSSGQYVYDALNHRVQTVTGGLTSWFAFDAAGRRASIWNGSTHAQLKGQYYWGSQPVAFYAGGNAHFQHQNWLGTERVRTAYNAGTVGLASGIEGVYGSLPYGDNKTSSGTNPNTDAYHYAGLDNDTESYTDHAQFRQYNNTQGRWMSPDPYAGSYDFSNPQSLNRYTYAGNNPLSATDTSGLEPCDDWWCDGGGEGGGANCNGDNTYECGGCDPIWDDCGDGPINPEGGGSQEPNPKDFVDLDPNHTMTESLGMPAGMRLPSGDILSIFGVSSGTPCEFGACGSGSMGLRNGSVQDAGLNDRVIVLAGIFAQINAYASADTSNNNPFKKWPLNGNITPATYQQDQKCSAGPVIGPALDSLPGVLAACQWHDNRYIEYNCNATSWISPFPGPCKAINYMLLIKIYNALPIPIGPF